MNMIKVLKNWDEIGECVIKLQDFPGPLHHQSQKNWDLFCFLKTIEQNIEKTMNILDVGATGSPVLEALLSRGYSNLYGIDLRIGLREKFTRIFMNAVHRRDLRILTGYSPIKLKQGDLCHSGYPDNWFSAITSLSVVEHGVQLELYFKEMYRILKPGGILLTSTDFWSTKLETGNLMVCGAPMKIFTPAEIKQALLIAFENGFKAFNISIPECLKPCVSFNGINYTFMLFVLEKI